LRPAAVAVPGQRGVLNPLHPVNRVVGLRPGQSWRQAVLDPTAMVLAGLLPGWPPPEPAWWTATVRPRPQPLDWAGEEVACLVIDYHSSEGDEAACWVRHTDGLVLRQEAAAVGAGRLVLQRNP
jgi:hypothetical protein